jgi:hypothetical protein
MNHVMMNLWCIETHPNHGTEPLHANGTPLVVSLQEFWQWSGLDLISNAQRGIFAEFLVAHAFGVDRGVRTEWDAYDVVMAAGIKVEVKATGFLQSWAQEKFSSVGFDIAPKLGWAASTNVSATEACRPADVYVFAVHVHTDQASLDPLNVNHSLGMVQRNRPRAVPFDGLCDAVAEAACRNPSHQAATA